MNKHQDFSSSRTDPAQRMVGPDGEASVGGTRAGGREAIERQKNFYREARSIVKDLFEPNATLFWVDFVVSTMAAYAFASLYLALPMNSVLTWICFAAAGVLLYRASLFVHEVVHMSANQMTWFRRSWNFFAGVPMMVPSFSYTSHLHHHSSRHYGTEHDGEYLPLASGSIWGLFVFLSQIVFQPLLVFFRYLIGTPISFLHPTWRNWMLTHASSLVINFHYEKDLKPGGQSGSDTFWELFTSFRAWIMVALVLAGVMPWFRLPRIFLLAIFALTLNHIRTLAAHRYRSDGEAVSHLEQFLDSTNVSGSWWTELLCPLGLRYHALHHLFPGIPYHNLGIAHRRLTNQLPSESVYHKATYPTISAAIADLVRSTRQNQLSESG